MTLRPRWRTLAYSVAALAGAAILTVYIKFIIQVDPFHNLRDTADVTNPIDIEFRNVSLKHWHNGKLMAEGQIGRVEIRRDRQMYDLYNVSNGIYHTADKVFHFEGAHAMWFPSSQRLEADRTEHVWGKSFDLKAPSFQYAADTSSLTIAGPATGGLEGGQVQVVNIVYNIANGAYSTGAIDWKGKFDLNLQDPDKSGPKPELASQDKADDNKLRNWQYHFDKSVHGPKKPGLDFGYGFHGTDGDSIVSAPEGSYDRDKEIITCTKGPVKYWSAKINLVCDHLVIYRKEHRAVATGNVVAYIKPEDRQVLDEKMEVPPFKPSVPDDISKTRPPAPMTTDPHTKELDDEVRSDDSIKKYPATVRCDKVVYWYKKGERHAEITGAPQALQEFPEGRWRMAWANHAFYDGEKERLKLFSSSDKAHDVRMKNSIGDDAVSTDADMSTKDGDESYEANDERGVYASTDEEANEAASKAAVKKKTPPAGQTTPPPTKPPISGPIGQNA